MEFRIADLPIHEALRDWMLRQFGETCTATAMLMLLTIVYVANRYVGDFEARHMQVVQKARNIATLTSRPQRVPTYREFEALFDLFDREFFGTPYVRGARFVSPVASHNIVEAILEHERAQARARIVGLQAA